MLNIKEIRVSLANIISLLVCFALPVNAKMARAVSGCSGIQLGVPATEQKKIGSCESSSIEDWDNCIEQKKDRIKKSGIEEISLSAMSLHAYVIQEGAFLIGQSQQTQSGEGLEPLRKRLEDKYHLKRRLDEAKTVFCLGFASHEERTLADERKLADDRAVNMCAELQRVLGIKKKGLSFYKINYGKHDNTNLNSLASAVERPIVIVLLGEQTKSIDEVSNDLKSKLREFWENDRFPVDICRYSDIRSAKPELIGGQADAADNAEHTPSSPSITSDNP